MADTNQIQLSERTPFAESDWKAVAEQPGAVVIYDGVRGT
jgi:hypothetical protein